MEKKKEEKRCGTDLSSIVSETARAARGARSRVRTGPCTIQIYVYGGGRCTCINRHSLTHREERSRLRVYTFSDRDRPAGQPTDRPGAPPGTYVSPFRARTCVCILSEATYTTSARQPGPVFRASLKGERSEKGESKTRRDADVRGGAEGRLE